MVLWEALTEASALASFSHAYICQRYRHTFMHTSQKIKHTESAAYKVQCHMTKVTRQL